MEILAVVQQRHHRHKRIMAARVPPQIRVWCREGTSKSTINFLRCSFHGYSDRISNYWLRLKGSSPASPMAFLMSTDSSLLTIASVRVIFSNSRL